MNKKIEDTLFKILSDNKNKHKYVSNILSDFSFIQKSIFFNFKEDKKTLKYLAKLHYKNFYNQIKLSKLEGDEITYLENALHARYKDKLNKLEK